jgi:hypothetical protein
MPRRRPRSLFGVRFSGIVCLRQSGASPFQDKVAVTPQCKIMTLYANYNRRNNKMWTVSITWICISQLRHSRMTHASNLCYNCAWKAYIQIFFIQAKLQVLENPQNCWICCPLWNDNHSTRTNSNLSYNWDIILSFYSQSLTPHKQNNNNKKRSHQYNHIFH